MRNTLRYEESGIILLWRKAMTKNQNNISIPEESIHREDLFDSRPQGHVGQRSGDALQGQNIPIK